MPHLGADKTDSYCAIAEFRCLHCTSHLYNSTLVEHMAMLSWVHGRSMGDGICGISKVHYIATQNGTSRLCFDPLSRPLSHVY